MHASRTALIATHNGDIVDDNGIVWHSATIRVGDTGGLMHYIRGWASDFRPPAWTFSYSTGELISNSGPYDLIGICTWHPSAGIYNGSIATVDGEFVSGNHIMIDGVEYTAHEFYDYCGDHNGQVITLQYRIAGESTIDQPEEPLNNIKE